MLISRFLPSTNFLNLNFRSSAPSNFFALANHLSTYCLWQEIGTPYGVEIVFVLEILLFRNFLFDSFKDKVLIPLSGASAPSNFFALANPILLIIRYLNL